MSSSIPALALVLATAAHADVRWTAGFEGGDLRQWGAIHCGGQGGSCPCLAPFWDPVGQVNYGSGSCSASNSNSPLSVAPANGRFQLVTPPGVESAGTALRVELRPGDLWPCATCSSATTRNEVVYTRDSGTSTPTFFRQGDDRYFAWSTYFPAEFSSWTCSGADPACPGGVPGSGYNPWNIVMQLHHSGDGGVMPLGIGLRRTNLSSKSSYALILLYGYNGGSSDRELWRQELQTGRWTDFVLHVRFSQAGDGVVELWTGNDGGPRARQTLACPSGASTTCNVATLYSDGADYLKHGLYRNSSIADTSVLFHKGMMDGDTLADVTGAPAADFSLSAAPASQMVPPGGIATYMVQTAVASGAAQAIALSVSGLPPGVTSAVFTPATVTAGGTSTLTLVTDPASPGVSGAFTIAGQYAGGSPSHAAAASITIAPPLTGPAPVATLVDSFGGTSIDPARWTVSYAINGTASEGGGSLNLAPRARSGSTQITVDSTAQYALVSSSATVQVPSVVSGKCSVNNRFLLKLDGGNNLGFWFECGTLYAFSYLNGVQSLRARLAYSATAHQFWRVRESLGTVFWETSPDKSSWTAAATAPSSSLFPLGALTVTFDSATWGTGLRSPGVARYAHLNE